MEMIGTKQAAEITGRSQQTISRWCRTGRIKGAEQDGVGSPWRMPLESILKMVLQNVNEVQTMGLLLWYNNSRKRRENVKMKIAYVRVSTVVKFLYEKRKHTATKRA